MNLIQKKMTILLFFLSMLFIFTSCSSKNQAFYDQLEEINKSHANGPLHLQNINISDYIPAMNVTDIGFTIEELDNLINDTTQSIKSNPLTYEQALQDVDLMFRLLKNCYGAYYYFGGDDNFELAKGLVLSDCKNAVDSLTVAVLQESLKNRLSFINDGHLRIENYAVCNKQVYCFSDVIDYLRDEQGFYKETDGEKNYLISVNGNKTIEDWMQYSVNNNGELIYRLGILSEKVIDKAEIIYQKGSETVKLSTYESKFQNQKSLSLYSFDTIDTIPVVTLRTFMDKTINSQFKETASTIKNSKISILDLRGNAGGHLENLSAWLSLYDPPLKEYVNGHQSTIRYTRASNYLSYKDFQAYSLNEDAKKCLDSYKYGMNVWETANSGNFEISDNENILFVLIDNQTFSAGEIFIAVLRNKENVVFVGTNTFGGILGDNGIKVVLPNSKTHVQFGMGMRFYYDETIFSEGTGFVPDIWVTSDALEQTLSLIKHYNLK